MTEFAPIPNYTELRLDKPGYDTRYDIDTEHPLYNDPLVDPREFGFEDASSYYAKPNKMTGEKLPGIPDAPLLRKDIVERLVRAEQFLQTDPDVREVLGAPAHLRIDDALRTYEVQAFAYHVAWPEIISRENPHLSHEEVLELVPHYCAEPKTALTPTPHLTAGALDAALVNMETGEPFDRGHVGGKIKGTAYPDFHEGYHLVPGQSNIENSAEQTAVAPVTSEIVLGRRVLHHAMVEVAGLFVNPEEIWHYGKGDPLSAYVSGDHHPYYGIAELPDWYRQQMTIGK